MALFCCGGVADGGGGDDDDDGCGEGLGEDVVG